MKCWSVMCCSEEKLTLYMDFHYQGKHIPNMPTKKFKCISVSVLMSLNTFFIINKKKTMLERWIPLLSFSKKPLYLCLIVGMWRWGLLNYSVRSLGSTGKWYLYNTMRNWIAKKGRGVDISVRYFDNFCKKKKEKKKK